MAAATAEFERVGVRRASIERIAQDAGVSRSTLYRRFPSKEDLLAEVVVSMRRHFLREISVALTGLDPRAAVVEAFCLAVTGFRNNALAKQILADDPGAIDLLIGFEAPQAVDLVGEFSQGIVTTLRAAGASMPEPDLRMAAETQFRLVSSFAVTSSFALDIDDADAVRAYAAKFLAPMIW
ncbi:helix-turn-helix domain-containing protein [Williamsia sp.]|uniref:TetR/AcrR family transcriptional regulator n=1 Tax=Williamsia sp. TaxID=1872085 RepID=UPI002F949685